MAKETVRFPDDLVGRIKEAVEGSDMFESRSEFHRVSSELLLDLLDPDHEPTNFSYRELRAEIEDELGVSLAGSPPFEGIEPGGGTDFVEACVTVRRRALHGDVGGAREFVREHYDPTAAEAILLDEVIGQHRPEGAAPDAVHDASDDARASDRPADGESPAPGTAAVEEAEPAAVEEAEAADTSREGGDRTGRAGTDGGERRERRPHQ